MGAKVSTLGSDAVDVFFVTDRQGSQLTEDHQAALRTTVLAALK
jgi:UTP:GlnB (protein PII) uridylyltransferase